MESLVLADDTETGNGMLKISIGMFRIILSSIVRLKDPEYSILLDRTSIYSERRNDIPPLTFGCQLNVYDDMTTNVISRV